MGECSDYWCEHYHTCNVKCESCDKKERANDKPELHVILRRRSNRLMNLENYKKNKSKDR
jgi:hypothetical protein